MSCSDRETRYESADSQFDLLFHEKGVSRVPCLVSAGIDMLHRHIMWILHSFLTLDVLEKTSTTIVEMRQWLYGSC